MADSFEAEIRKLKENHETARKRLRTLTQVGRVLTLAVVFVMVGFLTVLYGKVTSMYAPENFEQPLQREVQDFLPVLEPQLRTLWGETAPVYGEMALQKFEEVMPAVQEAGRRELDNLGSKVLSNAQIQLNAALDRIAEKNRKKLMQHFPNLSTEDGAEEMGLRWVQMLEEDFEEAILYFHGRYTEDLGELEATLEQFRSERFDELGDDELIRQFAHLWLMKMDQVILAGSTVAAEENDHDN